MEIQPEGAILLYQEVLGAHTEKNARFFHRGRWQEWYTPIVGDLIHDRLMKDATKTQLLIEAIKRAFLVKPERSERAQPVTEQEARVLSLRFGLDGVVRNYAQVSRELGIATSGSPVLERRALNKIRGPLKRMVLEIAAFNTLGEIPEE